MAFLHSYSCRGMLLIAFAGHITLGYFLCANEIRAISHGCPEIFEIMIASIVLMHIIWSCACFRKLNLGSIRSASILCLGIHHQHHTTTHQMQHDATACMFRCFNVIIQVWHEPQALNTLSRALEFCSRIDASGNVGNHYNTVQSE